MKLMKNEIWGEVENNVLRIIWTTVWVEVWNYKVRRCGLGKVSDIVYDNTRDKVINHLDKTLHETNEN